MSKKIISSGVVHSEPADLRNALIADPAARAKWEDITPLARNEWSGAAGKKVSERRRQNRTKQLRNIVLFSLLLSEAWQNIECRIL